MESNYRDGPTGHKKTTLGHYIYVSLSLQLSQLGLLELETAGFETSFGIEISTIPDGFLKFFTFLYLSSLHIMLYT